MVSAASDRRRRGRRRASRFIDYSEISLFVEEMRAAPKELQAGIRTAVKEASGALTDEVRDRAAWSDRIPNAVKTRVSFAQRGSGVTVSVDHKAAPHARPYEGLASGGNRGMFRHPVYGNREVWVGQSTRPFFRPAIEATREDFVDAMTAALLRTLPTKG